jgi:serine/threonine protein kinase
MAKGLDVGTMNVISVRQEGGETIFTSQRNSFVQIEFSEMLEQMLLRSDVLHIRKGDQAYLVGDDALNFARIFDAETRRPMQNGILDPDERSAFPILKLLLEQVLGEPEQPEEPVIFSSLGSPVDADLSTRYHRDTISSCLEDMGYEPEPIHRTTALSYSVSKSPDYTGLVLDFGAGTTTVCLIYHGDPAVQFVLAQGGDWIDQKVAEATGRSVDEVKSTKENDFELEYTADRGGLEGALSIYYEAHVEYVVDKMSEELGEADIEQEATVPVVVAGGASSPSGFVELLESYVEDADIPLSISGVHQLPGGMYRVAAGALTAASNGDVPENRSETATDHEVNSCTDGTSTSATTTQSATGETTDETCSGSPSADTTDTSPASTASRRSKIDELIDTKQNIPDLSTVSSPPPVTLEYDDLQTTEDLGRGGQAVIKKAMLPDTKAPPEVVAVREPAADDRTVDPRQFLKKAETWKMIDAHEREKQRWESSEHIVGVIDTGEDLSWIAMEYMDGGDLDELLREHPSGLPLGQALWVGACVCKGLEIAHQLGRAHLDIKPKNVFLKQTDGWPWPKLGDWGLARTLARESDSRQRMSAEYAGPEQFAPNEFGDVDQLTDVYQTGALMYALLTGGPPVTGGQVEVQRQITGEGPIAAPSERRPELPAVVDAAVGQALERPKTERYDSITGFRKALDAIRTGGRLPQAVATRLEE